MSGGDDEREGEPPHFWRCSKTHDYRRGILRNETKNCNKNVASLSGGGRSSEWRAAPQSESSLGSCKTDNRQQGISSRLIRIDDSRTIQRKVGQKRNCSSLSECKNNKNILSSQEARTIIMRGGAYLIPLHLSITRNIVPETYFRQSGTTPRFQVNKKLL